MRMTDLYLRESRLRHECHLILLGRLVMGTAPNCAKFSSSTPIRLARSRRVTSIIDIDTAAPEPEFHQSNLLALVLFSICLEAEGAGLLETLNQDVCLRREVNTVQASMTLSTHAQELTPVSKILPS